MVNCHIFVHPDEFTPRRMTSCDVPAHNSCRHRNHKIACEGGSAASESVDNKPGTLQLLRREPPLLRLAAEFSEINTCVGQRFVDENIQLVFANEFMQNVRHDTTRGDSGLPAAAFAIS